MNFRDDTVDSNPEPCGESLFLTRDGTSPRSIDAALPASTQQLPRVRCQEQASRSERSEPEEIFAARGPNLEFAASAASEENFLSGASEENFADFGGEASGISYFSDQMGGEVAEGRGWGWEGRRGPWMGMGDAPGRVDVDGGWASGHPGTPMENHSVCRAKGSRSSRARCARLRRAL